MRCDAIAGRERHALPGGQWYPADDAIPHGLEHDAVGHPMDEKHRGLPADDDEVVARRSADANGLLGKGKQHPRAALDAPRNVGRRTSRRGARHHPEHLSAEVDLVAELRPDRGSAGGTVESRRVSSEGQQLDAVVGRTEERVTSADLRRQQHHVATSIAAEEHAHRADENAMAAVLEPEVQRGFASDKREGMWPIGAAQHPLCLR